MRDKASASWLLAAVVLLCGCGGGGYQGPTAGAPGGAGGVPSPSPSPGPNLAGNWQFSTTSKVSVAPPLTIAGSISQSGSSVSGAVHVNGSNCFDPLSTVDLTGIVTESNLSLTTTYVTGQVATFTGDISDDTLTGTNLPDQFTGTYTRRKTPTNHTPIIVSNATSRQCRRT